jgi:hypothetical protein
MREILFDSEQRGNRCFTCGVRSFMVQAMHVRSALIAALVLVAMASCHSQSESDVLTVKLDNVISMQERRTKTNEMREFLWNHRIQRKPASLMLTAVSKEGKVTHSEYRITLLPGNSLLLKVTFVRDRVGAQGQVIPKPDGDTRRAPLKGSSPKIRLAWDQKLKSCFYPVTPLCPLRSIGSGSRAGMTC